MPGGASKEAWAVDLADGRTLVVRRALGGVIHSGTLPLRDEYAVLQAACEAGVAAPAPVAYLGEVAGREAFAMERIAGETIGRRIVREPPPALDVRLAEELARIHAIPPARLPFLERPDPVARLRDELDAIGEPHPVIEFGLAWCAPRLGTARTPVVLHGDFRVGNLAIADGTLAGVLDWEFCHVGDPLEDLSWPFVRAWRFGADGRRLGGIAGAEAYLARYAALTGIEATPDELHAWEVFGNCSWAVGALGQAQRHLRGEEPSVELAILGRLACETELEILELAQSMERTRQPESSSLTHVVHDRPSAGELAEAVRGFLEQELLPTLADQRLRFRTLVAMNALRIVERESPPPAERDPAPARAIRERGVEAADLGALRADVLARLAVAKPQAG
ncbi:MAG: phosphotransferase family protein [Thermoleophilia bacterium]|nr:phosphotransferase family protein [Thermoleophilia bacterium]